jgi:hypothetical protein
MVGYTLSWKKGKNTKFGRVEKPGVYYANTNIKSEQFQHDCVRDMDVSACDGTILASLWCKHNSDYHREVAIDVNWDGTIEIRVKKGVPYTIMEMD